MRGDSLPPAPMAEAPYAPEPLQPAELAPPVEEATAPGASYAPPEAGARAPRLAYVPPAQDVPVDPAMDAAGPRGTSQPRPGEQRYDETGYAGVGDLAEGDAVVAAHRTLAPDTLVEVTSLENGRTIVALVTGALDPRADHAMDLSAGAARQLGHDGSGPIPVRIRKVSAAPGDMLALRAGRPATLRPDTPPVLLNALRKRLAGQAAATPPPAAPERPVVARPVPVRTVPPRAAPARPAPVQAARPAAAGGYYVQVAALSSAANAQSLAKTLHGFVRQGGGLHRVQLGPFANRQQAEAARARVARAGHGDARIVAN